VKKVSEVLPELILSLLPAAVQREYLCGRQSAQELVDRCRHENIRPQVHLTACYGNSPRDAAEKIAGVCDKISFSIIPITDCRYPRYLKEIADPPLVLYTRGGEIPEPSISVVGTRDSDPLSESVTERLCSSFCAAGYSIVSGMALGIDRAAHLTALKRGGATVGVCPNGIDHVYPQQNRDLFERAGSGLVLVSEHPPRIRAGKWAFARRNRIISGFSRKCVVVKASKRSGAMITARYAAEQGRDLFVCPGHSYDESYEGCISLINSGAVAIYDASSLIDDISAGADVPVLPYFANEAPNGSPLEAALQNEFYSLVAGGCNTIDELVERTGKPASEVLGGVMQLSLNGQAELLGDHVRICR